LPRLQREVFLLRVEQGLEYPRSPPPGTTQAGPGPLPSAVRRLKSWSNDLRSAPTGCRRWLVAMRAGTTRGGPFGHLRTVARMASGGPDYPRSPSCADDGHRRIAAAVHAAVRPATVVSITSRRRWAGPSGWPRRPARLARYHRNPRLRMSRWCRPGRSPRFRNSMRCSRMN
jgi:hypothetical protein